MPITCGHSGRSVGTEIGIPHIRGFRTAPWLAPISRPYRCHIREAPQAAAFPGCPARDAPSAKVAEFEYMFDSPALQSPSGYSVVFMRSTDLGG